MSHITEDPTHTDEHRDTAMKTALEAARKAAGRPEFYETIIAHWLTLDTASALSAALGALQAAGFHVDPRARSDLHKKALETARTEFWRRHRIIDALDADVAESSITGVAAALDGFKPPTAAEAAAALKAVAKAMVP